jgi:DNA-binding transcriptional LysR family regulator
MELQQLRYFIAVAENLNFTRAAAQLHLAQPSITRQIHNLEDEIGVLLLDRTKNHVSLTEEGHAFLAAARGVVALAAESVRSVQLRRRGETGQLNIAYSSNFSFELFYRALEAFREASPGLALKLFEMTPAEQFRALEARSIDLGCVGFRPTKAAVGLKWACIASDPAVVVLPSRHPLAKKNRIALEELKTMFFVAVSEKTHPGFREWLDVICGPAGFTPKIFQDAESEPGLMVFVGAGMGVALAREQIKKLPHQGVVFRSLTTTATADYCIAWNQENHSKALFECIQIARNLLGKTDRDGRRTETARAKTAGACPAIELRIRAIA